MTASPCAPQERADSSAGLLAGTDGAEPGVGGLAGWAGRNRTARMAPAAATPPATRQPMLSPCRNAFVAAVWGTRPRAAGSWPDTPYAAPSDWCAMSETRAGSPVGRVAVSRDPYSDA